MEGERALPRLVTSLPRLAAYWLADGARATTWHASWSREQRACLCPEEARAKGGPSQGVNPLFAIRHMASRKVGRLELARFLSLARCGLPQFWVYGRVASVWLRESARDSTSPPYPVSRRPLSHHQPRQFSTPRLFCRRRMSGVLVDCAPRLRLLTDGSQKPSTWAPRRRSVLTSRVWSSDQRVDPGGRAIIKMILQKTKYM